MLDQEHLAKIAKKIGITADAHRKWWERGHVPHCHRMDVIHEAAKCGIPTDYDALGDLQRVRKRKAA